MAERLAVDGDELTHFMRMLRASTDALADLRGALSDATVTGLGTRALDTACEDFQDDWRYGAEEIGAQTDALSRIVGHSKDSYRELDQALEAALSSGGAAPGAAR
ncbi:hypothetical protein ACFVT5_03850 [Streptomyces sp. NPDC058001]|uniref:hypothetical protein n=1 Tax=Streptomyces sp. NPDC058001 TaxID=3346300 RepID=UPI0036E5C296